ncbi:MAG: YggS family pyridoxal phosphate-dependent enzyme [Leptospiraceae bacterium]|nr:YggS family pyridoxal phosphate-dependent enzyme [Leptospiraceae bacterium]MCZ8345179.1 YggS family pyridoxal phosphate-dependent enzyme [Leptospiraceae bacterium]
MNFGEKYFSLLEEAKKISGNENVTLVAVSKKHPFSSLESAYEQGIRIFGENSVQEGSSKWNEFEKNHSAKWQFDPSQKPIFHHIGPLQSGNIKKVVGVFGFVHGLGSWGAWKDLAKRALTEQVKIQYFLQFNLSKEDTKHGFEESDLDTVLKSLLEYSNEYCSFAGLMTMGPSDGDAIVTRKVFKELRMIRDQYFSNGLLSMGMSGDYKIALEEGSNLIRIGTAIFGERNYG